MINCCYRHRTVCCLLRRLNHRRRVWRWCRSWRWCHYRLSRRRRVWRWCRSWRWCHYRLNRCRQTLYRCWAIHFRTCNLLVGCTSAGITTIGSLKTVTNRINMSVIIAFWNRGRFCYWLVYRCHFHCRHLCHRCLTRRRTKHFLCMLLVHRRYIYKYYIRRPL